MWQKRAQVWGMDLTIASVIFITGILIFYLYIISDNPNKIEFKELSDEGEKISSQILSEKEPLGILSNNKINQTKLEELHSLVDNDYKRTKSLLGVKNDYYITISNGFFINENKIDFIGEKPSQYSDLIKTSRITIYKNKIATLEVNVWK